MSRTNRRAGTSPARRASGRTAKSFERAGHPKLASPSSSRPQRKDTTIAFRSCLSRERFIGVNNALTSPLARTIAVPTRGDTPPPEKHQGAGQIGLLIRVIHLQPGGIRRNG